MEDNVKEQSIREIDMDPHIWMMIALHLSPRCFWNLRIAWRWFRFTVVDGHENFFRTLLLHHLGLPDSDVVSELDWKDQFVSAILRQSHIYQYFEKDRHLDRFRLGGFFVRSADAQWTTKKLTMGLRENLNDGMHRLSGIKTGVWIADLHMRECPYCEGPYCDVLFTTLALRHSELLLMEAFQEMQYDITEREIYKNMKSRFAMMTQVEENDLTDMCDYDSWTEGSCYTYKITQEAVAVDCEIRMADGEIFYAVFSELRDEDGKVVSILFTHYARHTILC